MNASAYAPSELCTPEKPPIKDTTEAARKTYFTVSCLPVKMCEPSSSGTDGLAKEGFSSESVL